MSVLARIMAAPAQGERARRLRRAFPIHMYVGRNGSGKSMMAVYDTLPDLEKGRPVLSTVRILDYNDPRPCQLTRDQCPDTLGHDIGHDHAHPLWIPFLDWPQLLQFKHGVVLMDEIVGVADSAESSSIPPAVRKKFQELRRDDVQLRITGLNWIRAHKRIREAVKAVTRCESFMPVTNEDAEAETVWRARRLCVARTYDSQSLPVDDHTDKAYETADLLTKARYWIPDNPAIHAYDTLAAVTAVGSVSEAGTCENCGGHRTRLACACPDYVEKRSAGRVPRKARSAEEHPEAAPGSRPRIIGREGVA